MTAGILYLLAIGGAIATQLTVRKLLFPLVWSIAFVSTLAGFLVYGVMSGLVGTPWGHLIPGT